MTLPDGASRETNQYNVMNTHKTQQCAWEHKSCNSQQLHYFINCNVGLGQTSKEKN